MVRRVQAWSGPVVIALRCFIVWAGLDDPHFVRGYLYLLAAGARLALLGLAGMAIWSLGNRTGRR